jgi:hypothetical protein
MQAGRPELLADTIVTKDEKNNIIIKDGGMNYVG